MIKEVNVNKFEIYGFKKPRRCKTCPMIFKRYEFVQKQNKTTGITNEIPDLVAKCIWTKELIDPEQKLRPQNCPTRKPTKDKI